MDESFSCTERGKYCMRNQFCHSKFYSQKCGSATGKSAEKCCEGTVTDESGLPVPGASVVVVGTTEGTVTDMDGAYSLALPRNRAVLRFSFIGLKSVEF